MVSARFGAVAIYSATLAQAGFVRETVAPVLAKRQDEFGFEDICKDLDYCRTFAADRGFELESNQLANAGNRCVPRHQGFLPGFAQMSTMRITKPLTMTTFDTADDIVVEVNTFNFNLIQSDATDDMAPQALENGVVTVRLNVSFELLENNSAAGLVPLGNFQMQDGGEVLPATGNDNRVVNGGVGPFAQTTTLPGGNQNGLHRICIMPQRNDGLCPIMPKAQRAAEHDCVYVIIKDGGVNGGDIDLNGLVQDQCQISNGAVSCPGGGNAGDDGDD